MTSIEVTFRSRKNGGDIEETRTLSERELSMLLEGATVVNIHIPGSGLFAVTALDGLTLILKDGRKCTLEEQNCATLVNGSEGWISIVVDEEW